MVSIIIPVYNTEIRYLNKCLRSVLNQTYQEIEIIIIDDGSKKVIAELCDKLVSLDKRIIIKHKKNGGVSSARNVGLKMAKGEYIAFVDADDWIEPDYIERLLNAIEINIEIAICNISYDYGENLNSNLNRNSLQEIEYNKSEIYKKLLHSKEIGGFLCNKLFRKEFITKKLDESLHYSEDYVFVAEYCRNIRKAVYIDDKLYHYRQEGNSATNEMTYNSRIHTLIKAYKKIEEIYREELPAEKIFLQKNTLKIALNLRARYLTNKIENEEEYTQIIEAIKSRWKIVLKSSKISFFTKLNIIVTFLFPKTMLKMKNKILGRDKKSEKNCNYNISSSA